MRRMGKRVMTYMVHIEKVAENYFDYTVSWEGYYETGNEYYGGTEEDFLHLLERRYGFKTEPLPENLHKD